MGKFKTLFNEEEVDFPENLDNLITPCITKEENTELCGVPTQSEMKNELFQMQTLKAPRPDGFPILFYKKWCDNILPSVSQAFTSLAMVARNEFGEVLKVWAKIHDLCTPTQAEAGAILWALSLAIVENWCNIIVEGDSKICFDVLSKVEEPSDWSISSIIRDATDMSVSFDNYEFC